jgi:hypothetical protein
MLAKLKVYIFDAGTSEIAVAMLVETLTAVTLGTLPERTFSDWLNFRRQDVRSLFPLVLDLHPRRAEWHTRYCKAQDRRPVSKDRARGPDLMEQKGLRRMSKGCSFEVPHPRTP